MKKRFRKNIALIICMIIMINMLTLVGRKDVYAAQICEIVTVHVDGVDYKVRGLNHEYDNNLYLSLVDLSKAMAETDRAFEVEFSVKDDDDYIIMQPATGMDATGEESEEEDPFENFTDGEAVKLTRKRIPVKIGDNDFSFYIIMSPNKENRNCYMNCGELALAMNIDLSVENGEVFINSKGEFDFNKYNFNELGLESMADSCIVGDITTGNIYYQSNENEAVTIASTTKLMTYLILKEAMEKGEISENDTVRFSKKAQELADSSSGVVKISEGDTADIMDVISAMLICSSNECSLALAEHTAGSEEAFVERMNQKAVALGLSDKVKFYNPHGLPIFAEDVFAPKIQNRMTAKDMFELSTYILNTYPEITEITSIKKTKLESLKNFEAKNTNALLHNIPGVVGLKTGTTDKAQSCLVSAYKSEDVKGDTHYIVTVVYGCENAQTQNYLSLLLMRYGIQKFNAAELGITPDRGDNDEIPVDLEGMIGAVVNTARRNSR